MTSTSFCQALEGLLCTGRQMIEVDIDCPYCGEPVALAVDETGGPAQTYVEDCTVCCRPIEVTARYDGEDFEVTTRTGDGE